jgi:hypothetical protein
VASMGTTIRRWSIGLPRLRWIWRSRISLEGKTLEELAEALPEWGRAEVRSRRGAGPQGAFTRDDWILMERMGRPR